MSYFYDPADDYPLDDDYYMLFARQMNGDVQMFVAFTTKGDDEFDGVAGQLGLKYITHVVNDFGAALDWAKREAKRIAPDLPVEIRLMEDGEVVEPSGWLLLPVADFDKRVCESCGTVAKKHWKSIWKWDYPVFCSKECIENWYVKLPFNQEAAVPITVEI